MTFTFAAKLALAALALAGASLLLAVVKWLLTDEDRPEALGRTTRLSNFRVIGERRP